jgi:hypothetical protein
MNGGPGDMNLIVWKGVFVSFVESLKPLATSATHLEARVDVMRRRDREGDMMRDL